METIKQIGLAGLALLLVDCTNTIGTGDGDSGQNAASELTGAGGRELTEFWPEIDIAYSKNARMLNYEMIRNEVRSVTGLSWVLNGADLWEPNRLALGGADYVDVWYEDRTPSQQKMVILRKMAFTVCGDLVSQESGQDGRTVFNVVDPAATIAAADPQVASQVESLYERFFFDAPSQEEVDNSVALLGELQGLQNASEAWRGLCAAYMTSIRFLTY